MFKDLTLQQFCALDHNRNMVITAGPGAGKTRILSHRYCFILLSDDRVSVPEILTLTFTEKAAEEMKGRIYEILTRLEKDLEASGNIILIKRIRKAKDEFYKNRISTIHSFCANLLRENPVESGTDPGFSVIHGIKKRKIMDRSIESALSSLWNNDRDLLIRLFQSFSGRINLINAVRNLIEHPLTFRSVIDTCKTLFKGTEWMNDFFSEYCRLIKEKDIFPYLEGLRSLNNATDRYKELLNLLDNWRINAEKDHKAWGIPDLFREMRSMAGKRKSFSSHLSIEDGMNRISYPGLVEEFYPDIYSHKSPDIYFEKEMDLFLKVANTCLTNYQSEKEKNNTIDFSDLEARAYLFLSELYRKDDLGLLKRVQKKYRYIMVDEFQDCNRFQWDIISLLCSDSGNKDIGFLKQGKLFVVGDKRQAIYRFRGGDVTVFEAVIKKIKESNPEKPPEIFWEKEYINNLMSSIYGEYPEIKSRHVDNFNGLPDSERDNIMGGDIYLPHNFRTGPWPVNFFNTVFEEIFSNKGAGEQEKYETAPKRMRIPHKKYGKNLNNGSVTFYLTKPSYGKKDRPQKEADLIADIIEGITGKLGTDNREYKAYPDIREKIEKNKTAIGILFFTFRNLRIFESVFREAGLPFVVHRGKGFFRCSEIMDILQLLYYLTDERQKISLLSALRSPIFGVTDPEIFDLFYGKDISLDTFQNSGNIYMKEVTRQIREWRILSSRLTIAELIRKIIDDRSVTAIHSVDPGGPQKVANIRKFLEIARSFQSEGNGSLPEFVEYCIDMADQEEEEGEALVISDSNSSINLMTIHAAKGLEFPMVILPDLDRRPPNRLKPGRPLRISLNGDCNPVNRENPEGEIPIWPVEVPELNYLKKYTPLGYLLTRKNRLEEIAENRRVFYVGCTRTENHLILLGSLKKRMMEKKKSALTSDDYRERASVFDILDDIYNFNHDFPDKGDVFYPAKEEQPAVIWREPCQREFKGIEYKNMIVERKDFGSYNKKISELDLIAPVKSAPYFQLSFKSIQIFKKCPIRFYYNVVLGAKPLKLFSEGLSNNMSIHGEGVLREEDKMDYSSETSLFLGSLVHDYLEKHHFGEHLNKRLFEKSFEYLCHHERMTGKKGDEWFINAKETALAQLKRTISDDLLIKLMSVKACYSEVPFLFTPVQGVEFRGIIDRLFRKDSNGRWGIIDWKSNILDGRDPEAVAMENNYHLQLACYKWAAESILHEKVDDLFIYFTDCGQMLKSRWDGHPEDTVSELLEKIKDYEQKGEEWIKDMKKIKKESNECRFCEYGTNLCKNMIS